MVPPRNPHHPQDSTRAPPHLPSNPLQLYHQASGLSLHQSLPWQNVPDQPWFWTAAAAGITSGPEARFCMTEPTAESGQHSQMSSAPSSYKKSAGSRNSPSDQELDTQPGVERNICVFIIIFCFHLYSSMFTSVFSSSALLCRRQWQHHRVQSGEQGERKVKTHLLRGRTTQLSRVRHTHLLDFYQIQFSTTAQGSMFCLHNKPHSKTAK